MVDLAMSIFEFLTKFLVIWHPWHPWVCIRSDLKPLETDISDSSYCAIGTWVEPDKSRCISLKCVQKILVVLGVVDMWHLLEVTSRSCKQGEAISGRVKSLLLKIFKMMPRNERIGKYFNKQVLFLKTVGKKITYLGNCKWMRLIEWWATDTSSIAQMSF